MLERPRFRDRLGRARSLLADQLAGLRRRGKLDQESWDELEEALILADVGISHDRGAVEGPQRRGSPRQPGHLRPAGSGTAQRAGGPARG